MTLPYYVPDPTSPAIFHAAGPLGAGRMQFLASNASLLQQANARRVIANHRGISGWSATYTTGYVTSPGVNQIQWGLGVKSGGCAICLGDVIIPAVYPSSQYLPGIILTLRARVQSGGSTASLVFAATWADGTIEGGTAAGQGSLQITNTAFEYATLSIGCPIANGPTIPPTGSGVLGAPDTFSPVPSTAATATIDRGTAYRMTLWFGGAIDTGLADCLGLTAYLVAPTQNLPSPNPHT